jgi:hypothetical protein
MNTVRFNLEFPNLSAHHSQARLRTKKKPKRDLHDIT